ncbi:5231_t:CDS:2 [Gigaspora margarita]|uniref:5231_t:CDS:1 n=1 Tax=Gigaspora margarita TaxID=4874 RepID=A0ABN7UVE5_GIGMA|nr:5231_t:CDS:2 [Gigaspora margarita]
MNQQQSRTIPVVKEVTNTKNNQNYKRPHERCETRCKSKYKPHA